MTFSISFLRLGLICPLLLISSGCFLFDPPEVAENSKDQGSVTTPDQGPSEIDAGRDQGEDIPDIRADMVPTQEDMGQPPVDMPPSPPADWHARQHERRLMLSPTPDLKLPDETFVGLVKLRSERIDFERLHQEGADIVFFSHEGVKLHHEIEHFSKSEKQADIWVEYPASSSQQNAPIWMYFDTPAPEDSQNPEDLWSNYLTVQHFSRFDATSQLPQDASRNAAHPHEQSIGLSYEEDAIAGLAPRFRKDNEDEISFHEDLDLSVAPGSQRVYELWFKVPTEALVGGEQMSIFADDGACRGFSVFYGDGGSQSTTVLGRLLFANDNSGCDTMKLESSFIAYQNTTVEAWHHLALVLDRPSETFEIWIDGARDSHSTQTNIPEEAFTRGGTLTLGNSHIPSSRSFIGAIDEFRVWNGVRSDTWHALQDEIGRDQFFVYGQPQSWK
ncbi:MAG: DUF2341 domain-containing protein [Myxococcota bacterium]|nr:DUF2341 domain-containing protein [Myxococcota bacterium]MEC9439578.1 DUF2341 domain-containing protein [Myxococcota bacterium]